MIYITIILLLISTGICATETTRQEVLMLKANVDMELSENHGPLTRKYDIDQPLPDVPGEPNYSAEGHEYTMIFWREHKADDTFLPLVRFIPHEDKHPFVCSGRFAVKTVNDNIPHYYGSINLENRSADSCGDLYISTTYILDQYSHIENFDDSEAFTIIILERETSFLPIPSVSGDFPVNETNPGVFEAGIHEGKKQCIDNPKSCGINEKEVVTSTLSTDLKLHIPDLEYNTGLGTMFLWADMQYYSSEDGSLLFEVTNYGQK